MNHRFLLLALLIPLCVGCAPKSLAPQVVPEGILFAFSASAAKSVSIVGSFNHWDPNHDKLTGPSTEGIWTTVLPLFAGQYEYRFVINGTEWVLDPSVPAIDDGLGGQNSVLIVEP